MPILKIYLTVSDELLSKINTIAEQNETDINSLVSDYLSNLAESGLDRDFAMIGNLRALFSYSTGRITRGQAKDALGVDDWRLTTMLRMAGFPPPRASIECEDAELEQIKDLHFE